MSNKAIDVLVIDLTDKLIDDIVKLREMIKSHHPDKFGIQVKRSQGETVIVIELKKETKVVS